MIESLSEIDQNTVDEGVAKARRVTDRRLRALMLAQRVWKLSLIASKEERLAYARELDGDGLFSLSQLEKITRTSRTALSKALGARRRPGGRFEPTALSALVSMRRSLLADQPISKSLIGELEQNGTSVGCVCTLLGLSSGYWYTKVRSTR